MSKNVLDLAYEQVADEVARNDLKPGLVARVTAEALGDEKKGAPCISNIVPSNCVWKLSNGLPANKRKRSKLNYVQNWSVIGKSRIFER